MNLELNKKQFEFFGDTIAEFADENKHLLTDITFPEKSFMNLCNKMLASEDSEIRVDLSRILMFNGMMRMMEMFVKFNQERFEGAIK